MSEREVKAVTFSRRPDLKFFVRALTAFEDSDLYRRIKAVPDGDVPALTAEQLSTYACDEKGEPLFADAAAALEFMKTARSAIVQKIIKVGSDFQDLDDPEAQEQTLKN